MRNLTDYQARYGFAYEPEPEHEKRGEWILIETGKSKYRGCSECSAPIPVESGIGSISRSECTFCYRCGAVMVYTNDDDKKPDGKESQN